jgi:hypothetical protein
MVLPSQCRQYRNQHSALRVLVFRTRIVLVALSTHADCDVFSLLLKYASAWQRPGPTIGTLSCRIGCKPHRPTLGHFRRVPTSSPQRCDHTSQLARSKDALRVTRAHVIKVATTHRPSWGVRVITRTSSRLHGTPPFMGCEGHNLFILKKKPPFQSRVNLPTKGNATTTEVFYIPH